MPFVIHPEGWVILRKIEGERVSFVFNNKEEAITKAVTKRKRTTFSAA